MTGRRILLISSPLFIPLASVFAFGCASSTAQGPAWPEQSSPSYPEAPPYQGPLADLAEDAGATQASNASKSSGQARPKKTPTRQSEYAQLYGSTAALKTLKGRASYYADSLAGNHTANGDIYKPELPTAAHKKLAFGTIVRVTRIDNSLVTYVRVNDRGPFGDKTRIIDLSRFAAKELDMMAAGVVDVRVEIVHQPK